MAARKLVPVPAAADDHRRLPYHPALDGLRGLAVTAVLLFHFGYPWAKGGYLGVSVFFTLSGFLITSLLVAERTATGRTDLRRFWGRRVRRLLPAALCGLILAAAVSRTMTVAPSDVRWDVLAALADVANWRFLFAGQTYAALFTAPSPVLHFWSLSIEEQFYALFPLLFVLVSRRRMPQRALLRSCLVGIAISWAALVAAGIVDAHDFAYYATITRAGELLVGAATALLVVRGRRSHQLTAARRTIPRDLVPLAALAGLVVLCTQIADSSRALERGVLPLVSVLSAIVVAGACRPGPCARLLAWRPLTDLGRISYGVYVYHWPLLLWLTPARTGWHGVTLNAVRLLATLTLATASYVLIERPIRTARWPRPGLARVVAPAAFAAAALLIVVIVPTARPVIDFAAAQADLQPIAAAQPPRELSPATAAPLIDLSAGAPRVAFFGDSTALMTAVGLADWATTTGRLQLILGRTPLGCSISRGGEVRFQGGEGPTKAECDEWPQSWESMLTASPVDIAIVQEGPWEVADRRLPGDTTWRGLGDPVLDSYVHDELLAAIDLLERHVKVIVWLTSPKIETDRAFPNPPPTPWPENDPSRMERYNQIVRDVAAERPRVRIVELGAHLASLPGGELDNGLRPDGIHFGNDTTKVIAPWIGEQVLALAGSTR
jgi:peptidoglycan/LPS O-acetylase OafA/YrhL